MRANHINPRIGGTPLQKLTPIHLQGLFTSMRNDGVSPRTQQIVFTPLRKATGSRAGPIHRRRMLADGHLGSHVFCDTDGGPIRKSNLIRRSFKPLLVDAKLPDIRFHDLRHTAATLLLSQEVHPKVVHRWALWVPFREIGYS